ncbi:MAG TPA: CopD family protein, partial [Acidimicrobiia bacterium]|nr:CopD family protein [Acidimicrobiia bacterium]
VSTGTLRLFLHVLAATVWVGGQLTLAGLVPGLRALGPDVPRTVARRFNRIAWPAFAVLFVTGLWNLSSAHVGDQSTEWIATLLAKLVVVALSGISAALHTRAATKRALALWGALSGLSALLALFYGVQLHG